MKKIFSIFAAALFAVAVNAQTDFAAPGYSCAADDAILSGSAGATKFYLSTESTPHYIGWNDVGISTNSVAKWTVTATRGCYVTVTLDLGPVVANNKHVFEVKILDAQGNVKGTVAEGLATDNGGDGYPGDYDKEKLLDGTILLPAAGDYMVELRNIRNYGKGSVKNVILTYSADAPSEIIDVTSVELNKNEVTLDLEEVELLAATVSPDNATDPTVTWESSDESVATVNENGLILAIAEGTATITAKAGEKSATCEVTVAAAAIPDVDFSEPYVLAGKVAHLEGAIWKNEDYKLYGDGGYNKNYGTAIWNINVTRPCIVSGVLNGVEGGHIFGLDLYQGEEFIGSLEQPDGKTWSNGEIALDGTLTFAAAGNYTLKLRNTQDWSSGKVAGVTLTLVEDLTPPSYYLTGTFNSWATNDENYKFDVNPEADGEYMLLGVSLEANAGIKVVCGSTFYPEGYETEKVIAESGIYDIYFRPDGQGYGDWHYGYFVVVPASETAIDNTNATVKTVKVIENGQMFIIKNGVKYDVLGTIVK